MSVLWCGGEDTSFPNGTSLNVNTDASFFRSGFCRCALGFTSGGSSFAASKTFASATSAWLSFQFTSNLQGVNSVKLIGLGDLSTNNGLFIGYDNSQRLCITKVVGGVVTTLANTSQMWAQNVFSARIDAQIISLGSNGTVNVYMNGKFVLTYTGDIAIGSPTAINCVLIGNNASSNSGWVSEVIVADESTLGWQGLVSAAPNGNGTTQQWQNPAYTNLNPIVIDDANSSYTDVVGQDEQVTMLPEPAGNYAIKAVKIEVRANGPAGSVPTGIKMGFNNGTTVAVGNDHIITTDFETYEDIFAIDPTTGAAWATLSGYQLNLRSA